MTTRTAGAPRPATTRGISYTTLALVGITVLAAALRIAALSDSFFGDELFTYLISTRPDLHAVLAGVKSNLEITPPLYFLVAWLFGKLGDPFVWLRVPSLIAGVTTVPLVYVLGVRTVGRNAALAGAGLFALSPFAIFYATEARAYALMTLLAVLSTLTLLRAIESNERRWWVVLALLEAAAMYSHYTAVFVLAAQAGWAVLAHRERVRGVLLSSLGAFILFAPWLPFMRDDAKAPNQAIIGALEPFGPATVARNVGRLVDGDPFAPLTDLPGTPAFVLLGLASVAGIAGMVRAHGLPDRAAWRRPAALVGLLALAAPVGAGLYSAVSDDLFVARNLISSLPYLALAFAALLLSMPRRAAAAGLALAFVALAIGAGGTLEADTRRPPYDDVAAFIKQRARPGDVVLDLALFPGPPGLALEVHVVPELRVFRLGYTGQEQKAIRAARRGHGRIFYVRPEIGIVRGAVPKQVARRYREAESRAWSGWFDLTAFVYEPR